jgi:hypothetical protein
LVWIARSPEPEDTIIRVLIWACNVIHRSKLAAPKAKMSSPSASGFALTHAGVGIDITKYVEVGSKDRDRGYQQSQEYSQRSIALLVEEVAD